MDLVHVISDLTNINLEYIIIILGIMLYNFHYMTPGKFLYTNIIITCFVLAIYDTVLKHILLLHVNNDYYRFIINNIITIVVIDFLIYIIKNDINGKKKTVFYYFNLAFACFFYETIIFKLYNYNNLINNKLRKMTKTILRLATISILSAYLNNEPYDKQWFDYSFGLMFNFLFFQSVFEN